MRANWCRSTTFCININVYIIYTVSYKVKYTSVYRVYQKKVIELWRAIGRSIFNIQK